MQIQNEATKHVQTLHAAATTAWLQVYLEVLVQEVEEQQDWHKEGQGKGRGDPNQDDGRCQLQTTPQEECCKVCQVLVHV